MVAGIQFSPSSDIFKVVYNLVICVNNYKTKVYEALPIKNLIHNQIYNYTQKDLVLF